MNRLRRRRSRWLGCIAIALVGLLYLWAPDVRAESAGEEERLERLPDPLRKRVERFRNATPQEREARRERMLEELRDASPRERRRILRREGRLMYVLPEADREMIRRENEAFRDKHDLPSVAESLEARRDLARKLELGPDERRALRHRLSELPRDERRALGRDIRRFRELPEADREALEARLLELKSLGEEERESLRENARRWSEMPEERRERLRAQWKKFRSLPPEERGELLERALEDRSATQAESPE